MLSDNLDSKSQFISPMLFTIFIFLIVSMNSAKHNNNQYHCESLPPLREMKQCLKICQNPTSHSRLLMEIVATQYELCFIALQNFVINLFLFLIYSPLWWQRPNWTTLCTTCLMFILHFTWNTFTINHIVFVCFMLSLLFSFCFVFSSSISCSLKSSIWSNHKMG